MSMQSWFASLRNAARRPMARSRQRVPLCVEALEERTLRSANLIISSAGVFPQFNLVNPGTGGAFGTQVVTLSTGNIVVTDPQANNDAGAVYVFNGQSGALISTLTGSTGGGTGDSVGSGGVTALSNGNFVVDSPNWNGGAANGLGAVTWGSGTAGVSGTVSATNSLVGANAGDLVGVAGVTALSSGNYVVDSSVWNGLGAVTWGSGTAGVTGTISAANSLVGVSAGDNVGGAGVTALSNGNYVVDSSLWNDEAGAVTWGSGTAGATGAVSAANSLVGVQTGIVHGDQVGAGGVTVLSNGNYVVDSLFWNGRMGAATWGNGTTGAVGTVSAANSLVGSAGGDQVGSNGVTALSNGNYVVASQFWNGRLGAATWGSGTTGTIGTVSAANSLVGSTAGDEVGSSSVTALNNGNYVVDSPAWNGNLGAATWGSGAAGITGTISAANSLIGVTSGANGDFVGSGGVTALSNGNYVVDSPTWNGGMGAATWGSGTTGVSGTVSAANSLVGSTAGDAVSSGGVTTLSNGNYVVDSPDWSGGATNGLGAVTLGDGTAGTITGTISATNSLIGATAGDLVGSGGVTALTNTTYGANYVVDSPAWNGGLGAITAQFEGGNLTGTVSAANSLLVGTHAGDAVGSGGVTALGDGNYVISSPDWNGNIGAATWVNGVTSATMDGQNTIDLQNSIEGQVASVGSIDFQVRGGPTAFFAALPTKNGGQVTIGLTDPNQLEPTTAAGQTLTVTPGFVQTPLVTTDVVIGVTGAITISSPIVSPAGAGLGDDLTLNNASLVLDAGINLEGGDLTLSGNVSLGGANTAIVQLSAEPVEFAAGSTLAFKLNGTTAGSGFDQLQVQSDFTPININNVTLSVASAGGFAVGQSFVIVQGTQPITTTFVGQPKGSTISAGGQTFTISYLNDDVTLTVAATIAIAPTSIPDGTVGIAYSQQLTASGGTAPYTYAITAGALPAGLTISTAGLISGTPTTAALFASFTITATDAKSATGSEAYTLTINNAPLQITTTTLATYVTANTSYRQTIAITGGNAPITFTVSAGSLPAGLSLSPSTGVISGTPTTAGTSTFTITATDTTPVAVNQAYTVVVIPPEFVYNSTTKTLAITLIPSLPSFTFSEATTATGATTSTVYTFALSGSSTPSVTQTFTDAQLTTAPAAGGASVTVIGQGIAGTAILITNDTYTDQNGNKQETPARISLGSLSDAGAGTVSKFVGNTITGTEYTFLSMDKFPVSYAYAGRNDGTVMLFGTQGTGKVGFVSAGYYSYIASAVTGVYAHFGEGTPEVIGTSAGNAADFAYHYTSSSAATVSKVTSTFIVNGITSSSMAGSQTNPEDGGAVDTFDNIANGFVLNTAVAYSGNSIAHINDSPMSDTYVGAATDPLGLESLGGVAGYSYMFVGAYPNFNEFDVAYGFGTYYASSTMGGNDIAYPGAPANNVITGNWVRTF